MGFETKTESTNKQKVAEILVQDTRVAVNMDKVKTGYDADYYSVKRALEDMSYIDKVLKSSDVEGLSEIEIDRLKVIQGRNASHILVNQQKFSGDSKEMRAVKESIEKLEKLLADQTMNEKTFNMVESTFIEAMDACDYYTATKNPWFTTGKLRKQAVIDERKQLAEEYRLFQIGKAAFLEKLTDGKETTPMDLITVGLHRDNQVDNMVGEYAFFFEKNLKNCLPTYKKVCLKNNIEAKEEPKLSSELESQFNFSILHNHDLYNYIDGVQRKYDKSDISSLTDGRILMQANYLAEFKDAYETMHANEERYKKHAPLFDAVFKKLAMHIKACDGIAFLNIQIAEYKEKEELTEEQTKELNNLTDYYIDVKEANDLMRDITSGVIKKIVALEPLSNDEMESLGEDMSDMVKEYQNNFDVDFKRKEEKTPSDDSATGSKRKVSRDAESLLKEKNIDKMDTLVKLSEEREARLSEKRKADFKAFNENLSKAKEEMAKDMEAIKSAQKKRADEFSQYRKMALEEVTDKDLETLEKERIKANQREFEIEKRKAAIKALQHEVTEKRLKQAYKDYEQKMNWYESEMASQKEYIEWYEKHHREPAIMRKVKNRFQNVKDQYEKNGGDSSFFKDIEERINKKACYALKDEMDEWLKENNLQKSDLDRYFGRFSSPYIIEKKLNELLEKYRPEIFETLIKQKREEAEKDIDYEQRKGIPRANDLRMTPDYRAFRMNKLDDAEWTFNRAVEEFAKGEMKQASAESRIEQYFLALYDFAYHNYAMPDKEKLELQERLHKVKDRFDSQHKWTEIDENIKILKEFQAEMKVYIEIENKSVDSLMVYYIREDEKQLYDERMQEFLFSRIFGLSTPYIKVMDPEYAIPGLKNLQKPVSPSYYDLLIPFEEAEEMYDKEQAIKKNKKHGPSDDK